MFFRLKINKIIFIWKTTKILPPSLCSVISVTGSLTATPIHPFPATFISLTDASLSVAGAYQSHWSLYLLTLSVASLCSSSSIIP